MKMAIYTHMSFYYIMIWIIIILLISSFIICYARTSRLRRKIDKIDKTIDYMNKLFHNHFNVTDNTILDLRKERDELKGKLKQLSKEK